MNKHHWIAIGLSILVFAVFFYGATRYDWLEDDDPWNHALAAKYVSLEYKVWSDEHKFKYMDPYPPLYDVFMAFPILMGLPVFFTLKFFNALLCGLAIYLFFLFAKEFLKSDEKGMYATFVIAMLPSFMSHFIWSQTLAIVLMLLSFYLFEKKSWVWAIISTAGVLITQPSTAFVFGVMGVVYLMHNWKAIFPMAFGAVVAFLIYWLPMIFRHGGVREVLLGIGLIKDYTTAASVDTSGGVVYSLMDFMVAHGVGRMDQPIGLGVFVFLLLVIGIGLFFGQLKERKNIVVLLWLLLTFIGIQGNMLPIKLLPHRMWVFFSIPVALLVGHTIYSILQKAPYKEIFKYAVLIFIVVGIVLTSGQPKMEVNTSMWPPGTWFAPYPEIRPMLMAINEPMNKFEFAILMQEIKQFKEAHSDD